MLNSREQGAKQGPGVTRLAVTLTALAALLFAAPAAGAVRTEFYGIAQGQLDAQDRAGIADARVQTARFMLKWRDVERVRAPTTGASGTG